MYSKVGAAVTCRRTRVNKFFDHPKELAINVGTTPVPLTLPAYQGACGKPAPVAAHRCISPPAPVDAVVAVAI